MRWFRAEIMLAWALGPQPLRWRCTSGRLSLRLGLALLWRSDVLAQCRNGVSRSAVTELLAAFDVTAFVAALIERGAFERGSGEAPGSHQVWKPCV